MNGKDYPFKAGSPESAQEWVGTLLRLQKNTQCRAKRGSVVDADAAADASAAQEAGAAAASDESLLSGYNPSSDPM